MAVPKPQPLSPIQVVELHDRKLTIVSLIGCILEWYDFAAYGFFSDVIGKVFFPPSQSQSRGGAYDSAATIEAYVIFGAAFLMRPIGAILMGHVGDTRSRRTALTTSMFLMAVSTLLLGALPTYSQVGTWAYVLLLIMRLLQGLSAGGNLLTSLVFTTENHMPQYRGLYAGVMLSSTFVGLLLGSMVSAILRSALTEKQLLSWGWRVPFLAGFLAILAAFYLKYRGTDAHEQLLSQAKAVEEVRASSASKVALPMADAPVLAAPTSLRSSSTDLSQAPPRRPIRAMFARDNVSTVAGAFCMSVVSAFGLYFTFVWLATYMADLSPHTIPNAYTVNSINIVIATFIQLPLAGFLSDLYGRKRVMTIGATGLIVFSPLVMIWISLGNFSIALGSLVVLGSFYSLYVSSLFAWFVDSFDAQIRSTALGVIYNTAQALVGGFAPTIATLLVTSSSASSSSATYLRPGCLVSGLSGLAMVGLWFIAPAPKHPASNELNYRLPTWSSLFMRRRRGGAVPEMSQNEVSNSGLP